MTTITRLLLLATTLLFSTFLFGQTRYYVNAAASGAGDGSSWPNAYLDLQDALAASQYGDEIWVAQGTYYPTAGTDRNISFELKNGVKLYGGFAGIETQLSQRDWVANETVLSGDIGVQGDSTDNSYTILYINPCDSTTLVDGLGLKNGNANIIGSPLGIDHPSKSGGAIYIMAGDSSAYPRIFNCIFEYNYAKNNGGAVYGNGKNGTVSPQFHNCTFAYNNANIGGAINIIGKKNFKNVKNDFLNCTFQNNWSITSSGAVEIDGFNLAPDNSEHFDTIKFIGCNFINNHTGTTSSGDGDGGGLRIYNDYNNIEILNCSFIGNSAMDGAGISGRLGALSMIIENTSFTENFCVGGGAAINVRNFNNYDITHWSILNCYFGHNNANNSILSLVIPFFNFDTLTLKDNIFESNSNGIEMRYFNLTTIDNCRFTNNNTTSFLPLFFLNAKKSIVTNNIFSNNKCILFNQRYQTATDTITNCTFYNNLGNTTATQLFGTAHISNCIFNQEIAGNAFPFQSAHVTLENSLILAPDCSNLPAYVNCGSGNLYGLAPVFADSAAGDFHLLPNSPGINAGSNDVVNALGIQTDYDGNPRIKFCNVDMGAFEAPDYSLLLQSSSTNTPCANQANGTVQFQLLNGCTPYSYAWTKGLASGTGNTGLLPGNYAFTITDALGKEIETVVEIPALPSVEVTATVVNYNCTTGTTGSIALLPTAGTPPYEYQWMDGTTSPDLALLLPGDYTVTITDANGCSAIEPINIGTLGGFQVGISIHPITCSGASDGSATVQPIGGTMPFAWLWQDGETSPTLDSLSGGNYTATVTDALGCTGDIDFTITPPSAIAMDIETVQPLCFGEMGMATVTATGGTGSFDFGWDNGATTASTSLAEGPHSVTVTDEHGCEAVGTVSIQAPPQLQIDLTAEPAVLCFGANNGMINVLPTGGTAPYNWNGPVENLSAGSYEVTLTDSNGCSTTATATIAQHPEITITDTVSDASGPAEADGSILLNAVLGGTGTGYQFDWSNSAASQNLTGVPAGDYTLTITDSQGCSGVFSFTVDFESAAGEVAKNPFGAVIVPNPSGRAGASLLVGKMAPELQIKVFDAQGRLVFAERTNENNYALPKQMPAGSYQVVLENKKERMVLTWVVGE